VTDGTAFLGAGRKAAQSARFRKLIQFLIMRSMADGRMLAYDRFHKMTLILCHFGADITAHRRKAARSRHLCGLVVDPALCSNLHVQISASDLDTLKEAYFRLENPSLAVRLSSSVGMPVEAVVKQLGKRAPKAVVDVVSSSTRKAIEFVKLNTVHTIRGEESAPASPRLHKAAAATTGAVSGFFGLESLIIELPVTTGIMFRSIVDIARAEGESPKDDETIINAMQVFTMGSGLSDKDDAAETSYYGTRLALSKAVTDALQYLASHGVGKVSAPVLVRFISAIASRFGVVVTQKAMAQALPIVGAVGGGLVNTVFISHFQDMARGHFSIRRLERKYGADTIRDSYQLLVNDVGSDIQPT